MIKFYKKVSFKKLTSILAIVVLTLFSFQSLFAQQSLSLSDAIQRALKNNYQIQIASINSKIADNNNSWAAAGALPSLNLNLADNNRLQKIDNPASFINGDVRTIGISGQVEMQWVLFNGFKTFINKSRLDALQEQTEGKELIVIQNTIQAVILAYYDALVEQEKLKSLESTMKLSDDRYNYIKSKREMGAAATFDVLQTEIAYQNDRQNYLLQDLNFKNTQRQLALLLGDDVSSSYVLTDELKIEKKDFSYEVLKQQLDTGNTQLKNEYINQVILRKQFESERSNMMPRLALNMGTTQLQTNFKLNDLPERKGSQVEYYANFSLSFNLFNAGNVRRNMKNAQLQAQIGQVTLSEMKQTLNNRLATELDMYNMRKNLLELADNIQANSKLNLSIAEEKFKNGTLTSFEFRDIQLNALRAEINRLDALYNLIASETELMRLTGAIMK
jgi:outer membrane protein TolC